MNRKLLALSLTLLSPMIVGLLMIQAPHIGGILLSLLVGGAAFLPSLIGFATLFAAPLFLIAVAAGLDMQQVVLIAF
jgi:hypothetical protein